MLRRVARLFRVGLLLLGVALLAWWPLSWLFRIWAIVPFGNEADNAGLLLVEWGQTTVAILPKDFQYGIVYEPFTLDLQVYRTTFGPLITSSSPWVPSVTRDLGFAVLSLPLWLLAFICLSWPVTSFIIARRRRKGRGFEVQKSEVSQRSEGDVERTI